jgi:hypothetical protein
MGVDDALKMSLFRHIYTSYKLKGNPFQVFARTNLFIIEKVENVKKLLNLESTYCQHRD